MKLTFSTFIIFTLNAIINNTVFSVQKNVCTHYIIFRNIMKHLKCDPGSQNQS